MRTNKSHFFLGLLSLCMSFCDAAVEPKHHCIDFMLNADESDIDCGGPTCQVCSIGKTCLANSDCLTDACNQGRCVDLNTYPSCSDGKQNGLETDIDCGGTCGPCGVGKTCVQAADCAPALCSANKCGLGTGADGPLIVPVLLSAYLAVLAAALGVFGSGSGWPDDPPKAAVIHRTCAARRDGNRSSAK